jgi:hypothetical protein
MITFAEPSTIRTKVQSKPVLQASVPVADGLPADAECDRSGFPAGLSAEEKLTLMYGRLCAYYEVDMETLRRSFDSNGRHPDIGYDRNGEPVGYTVRFFGDALDKQLVARYGDEYRQMVNETRSKEGRSPFPF